MDYFDQHIWIVFLSILKAFLNWQDLKLGFLPFLNGEAGTSSSLWSVTKIPKGQHLFCIFMNKFNKNPKF